MRKIFAKFGVRDFLSFSSDGIEELRVDGEREVIEWSNVATIVFVDYFEEYSGYCLTEEYTSKKVLNEIVVNCKKNTVKVRTGGKQSVKKNVMKPFRTKFGTTCIYHVVCVEYVTSEGKKNIYATHFEKAEKKNQIDSLKNYLSRDKIKEESRVDGFVHLIS